MMVEEKLRSKRKTLTESRAESTEVELEECDGETLHIAVHYIPPQTQACSVEECEILKADSLETIQSLFLNKRLIDIGRFHQQGSALGDYGWIAK